MTAFQGPAYMNVLKDPGEVDDEEMEFERMRELLQEVTEVLKKAKAELTSKLATSAWRLGKASQQQKMQGFLGVVQREGKNRKF